MKFKVQQEHLLRTLLPNLHSKVIQKLGTASPWDLAVYGIPRGGVPVALLLAAAYPDVYRVVEDMNEAEIFVDDIIDSGGTFEAYKKKRDIPFFALIDKVHDYDHSKLGWVIFPWEVSDESNSEESIITRLLQFLGENPERQGLQETPKRVLKAWQHWTKGYNDDPSSLLKVFTDGAEGVDEMVTVAKIPFYSHCEHHLAPFFGEATVSYIPDGRIVGLSKISRLVSCYAHRLQVQERLTNQIAEALQTHLKPKGVGVHIKARHLCMESRGICQQGHFTVTNALRGVILSDPKARSEFMGLCV